MRQATDARLERLLLELDRACYLGLPWSSAALLDSLSELPARSRGPRETQDILLPLYK